MNLFTRLATTGVIVASTVFGVVEPAQAKKCKTYLWGTMCYTQTKSDGDLNRWDLTFVTPEGNEFIDVTCNDKFVVGSVHDWSSYGDFSQDFSNILSLATQLFTHLKMRPFDTELDTLVLRS